MADTRSTSLNVMRRSCAFAVTRPIKDPTVTDSCAALAHAMRELVSYYSELLMAKVKAKLPATVAAQLDNAEFLLNRTLTYEEFYETLNRPT